MNKLLLALRQKFSEQTLRRKPEMDLVMLDREQDEQFSRDGEDGGLAIVYDYIINTLLKVAPSTGRALDLCCGSGQLLSKIAHAFPGMQFTGVDLSKHMLNLTKENSKKYNAPNVSVKLGNMYHLNETVQEKFDLITWHLALHHCERDEDVVRVVDQLMGLLKERGTLFIFDIRRPKTGRIALEFAEMYNRNWGEWFYHDSLDSYKAAFTFDELENIIRRTKLKDFIHIEPAIANVFQIVCKSHTWNPTAKEVSNLKYGWQKSDYRFMKMNFRLRAKQESPHEPIRLT